MGGVNLALLGLELLVYHYNFGPRKSSRPLDTIVVAG